MGAQVQSRLFLWRACALVVGPGIDSKMHSHFATQLTVGLDQPFRARLSADAPWTVTDAAIFAPNQSHQIDSGGMLAHLFVDLPQHGDEGSTDLDGDYARLPAFNAVRIALQEACSGSLDLEAAGSATRIWLDCALTASRVPSGFDPRIVQALAWIAAQNNQVISGAELAARVHLSASRFTHLCRQQTGLSVTRYLLWTKLLVAVDAVAHGANTTAAAHTAGFADLAHMSRTFRNTFGVMPSELQRMTIAFKRERG
jgi:AraC family transcriptional regulator